MKKASATDGAAYKQRNAIPALHSARQLSNSHRNNTHNFTVSRLGRIQPEIVLSLTRKWRYPCFSATCPVTTGNRVIEQWLKFLQDRAPAAQTLSGFSGLGPNLKTDVAMLL